MNVAFCVSVQREYKQAIQNISLDAKDINGLHNVIPVQCVLYCTSRIGAMRTDLGI